MGRIVISNQIESLAKIEKKNEMQGFVVNKQTKSGSLRSAVFVSASFEYSVLS